MRYLRRLYTSIRQSFKGRNDETEEDLQKMYVELLDIGSIRDILHHREQLRYKEERFADEKKKSSAAVPGETQ